MAVTLGDLLIRRTHIFYETPNHGLDQLGKIADLVGEEIGWDAERKEAETAAYISEVNAAMAFREELDGFDV